MDLSNLRNEAGMWMLQQGYRGMTSENARMQDSLEYLLRRVRDAARAEMVAIPGVSRLEYPEV